MGDTAIDQGLTFDDVLLVPGYSTIVPKDADLTTRLTRDITMNIPLLSAAMDTVTEARLAIAMAEQGGIGVIHKSMSIEAQAAEVHKVKRFESGMVEDPMTVTPDTLVGDLMALKAQYHFSGMPVVAGDQVVGIITNRDIRFETDMSQKVANLMTGKDKLITVPEGTSRESIIDLFKEHRIEKVLVVNDAFQLKGMVTVTDIMKSELNPMACKDTQGRLRAAAAVSTGNDSRDRSLALIEAGVDVLVVDTSHGHSQHVLDQVAWIKQQSRDVQIIGGNIATAAAAEDLVKAGADAVKVGIGPGSICITRVVAGVGMPQISAIQQVHATMKKRKVPVIADGGIRYSGDISKAIAAGADSVMIGGLFAGTEEAPGEVVLYQGRTYKAYRGMGSVGAMSQGSGDRYHQEENSQGNYVPQGIEGRVPCKGPLKHVLYQLMGGVQSTMGYTGCQTIDALKTNTQFVRVTNAGVREGHAHSVRITKEVPNYSMDESA